MEKFKLKYLSELDLDGLLKVVDIKDSRMVVKYYLQDDEHYCSLVKSASNRSFSLIIENKGKGTVTKTITAEEFNLLIKVGSLKSVCIHEFYVKSFIGNLPFTIKTYAHNSELIINEVAFDTLSARNKFVGPYYLGMLVSGDERFLDSNIAENSGSH